MTLAIIIAVLIMFLFQCFFEVAYVNGKSMEPTFQNGDALLLKKWGVPKKDDIIIAYIEELDLMVVKRILAIEGDVVSIDESGVFKQWCICQNQEQKRIPEYEKCTVCFVHLYNRDLPLGRIRDHDNFEEKHVLDVISNFFLASDSGLHVDTYHITRMAEQDATEVYIMDTENFPKWLQKM